METLAELLHPITPEAFRADYEDRKPLHIPANGAAAKAGLLDWPRLNALLDQSSIWTADSLKLVFNGQPVPLEQYCMETRRQSGVAMRPAPARVQPLLSMGASLIANDAQTLTPEMSKLSRSLSEAFAGLTGANIYCSFGGVHAFDTHFDLHHVFAVQVEGRKTWRLYANRAPDPVELPSDMAEAKRWFQATRGEVMQEVEMAPGDVLYLPRGWYHDAWTAEGASLHVTFSVTPLYGRVLFGLLEAAAMQDPAFRAWLKPAADADGSALGAQLADLGGRLADIARSDTFRDEIAMAQQKLIPREARYVLPEQPRLTRFRSTGLTPPQGHGPRAMVIEWAAGQASVVLEDMTAQFDFLPEAAVREAVAEAERMGVLKRI